MEKCCLLLLLLRFQYLNEIAESHSNQIKMLFSLCDWFLWIRLPAPDRDELNTLVFNFTVSFFISTKPKSTGYCECVALRRKMMIFHFETQKISNDIALNRFPCFTSHLKIRVAFGSPRHAEGTYYRYTFASSVIG